MSVNTTHNTKMAWVIHVFTSTGAVAGFLGLLSVLDGSPRAALTWFMVAVVIDGLDGPMARHYDVGRAIPHIDGNSLDLMIDYVTCVVGPALFLHRFGMLPRTDDVSLICVGLILVSSLYVMSNKGVMSVDHYFNGFPAMWNFVVTILFVLQSRRWVNVGVVVVLVLLTFIPLKFIHAFRTIDFRKITIPVITVWIAAMMYVTWILDQRTRNIGCERHCLDHPAELAQLLVWIGTIWIVGVGVWRTILGRPSEKSLRIIAAQNERDKEWAAAAAAAAAEADSHAAETPPAPRDTTLDEHT